MATWILFVKGSIVTENDVKVQGKETSEVVRPD